MASGRPPVWKQILGAVIGGSLGLVVYTGYQSGKPAIEAWLTIPQSTLTNPSEEGTTLSDTDRDPEVNARFKARALEIERAFSDRYEQQYQLQEDVPLEDSEDPTASDDAGLWDDEAAPLIDGGDDNLWDSGTDNTHGGIVTEPKPSAPMIDAGQPDDYSTTYDPPVRAGKGKAPNLPDSGLGLWAGMAVAFAGAVGLRYRKNIASLAVR